MPLTTCVTRPPSLRGQLVLEQLLGALGVGLADAVARAPARHRAGAAGGLRRMARATPVEDQHVTEHRPVLAHEQPADLVLDLDGVLLLGPAEAADETAEVRIDRDAGDVEGVAE